MPVLYFYRLPTSVAASAFRDVVEKMIQDDSENPQTAPRPRISLDVPSDTTPEYKHPGHGYIEISDEKVIDLFIAKLKVEPIVFQSEKVVFTREKSPDLEAASSGQSYGKATRSEPVAAPPPSEPDTGPAIQNGAEPRPRPNGVKMNLNRAGRLQREKREIRPPNPMALKRLEHRLSVLGQHIRLERLEFGVLRDKNFSVEYSRSLTEEGGWMIFEDNEKAIRVTLRGSHRDPIMPSVAIYTRFITYVGLGTEGGNPYMFLALSQNPNFEKEDISAPSTGTWGKIRKGSRSRHSSLDERHERVAPYTSRWIRLIFHRDNKVLPNVEICRMAKIAVAPVIDPPLTFNKLDMYSRRNVDAVLKWVHSGSLDWHIAFQCGALFLNGTLVPQELLALRPTIEKLAKESPERARDALKTFRAEIEGAGARRTFNDFENKNVVEAFIKHTDDSRKSIPSERLQSGLFKSNFMCYHVKITPTAVHLAGPLAEQSNRIIRKYPGFESYFIRVSFTDEADGRTRFEYEVDNHGFTRERLGGFLKNWIQLGDRFYELLAYSQSGLQDHSCFFCAEFTFNGEKVNAQSIRDGIGNFGDLVYCPARYGARMSQAFSSTDPSVVLDESMIRHLPDIQDHTGKRPFTDGCATISKELAKEVWERMLEQMPQTRRKFRHEQEPTPCAFQIRMGGNKGMVRIDPRLQGRVLSLRPSMIKFEAPGDLSLEIARAPLIMLLWSAGVEDAVFETLMQQNLETAVEGMKTCAGIADQFMWNRLGAAFHLDHTFRKLARLGIELDQPGVRTSGVNKILNGALHHLKVSLKHKARIKVPDSYTLVGVCDEQKYLKYDEVYVCVRDFSHRTGKTEFRYLEGRVLVTRSPVVHPGDAQVLIAIGEPPADSPFVGEGNNLPNCVVFSCLGNRPVPNMLGGGDLGKWCTQIDFTWLTRSDISKQDLYNVIPYRELIPPHIYAPAEYEAAKQKKIGEPSTIEDVADFMVDYTCYDSVGMVATNHLLVASVSELRSRDERCMTNAELHSKAVDFIKNGYWVNQGDIRKPSREESTNPANGMRWNPDWQAGHGRDHTDGNYYECPSVLGRLFRSVELPFDNPTRRSDTAEQDPVGIQKCIARHVGVHMAAIKGLIDKFDDKINALRLRYTAELNHICASHTISSESSERVSEVEVMIGTNLEVNSKSDLIERMKRLTGALADFVRFELKGSEDELPYEWLARAWKAYLLTSQLGDKTFGALSFSWIALESVLDALQTLDKDFLSNEGLQVTPFSSIPSSGQPPEGPISEEERAVFRWETAEVEDPAVTESAQADGNRIPGQSGTDRRGNWSRANTNGAQQGGNGHSNGGGSRWGGSGNSSSVNTTRSSGGVAMAPGIVTLGPTRVGGRDEGLGVVQMRGQLSRSLA